MEVELEAAALTMKEVVPCSNIMLGLIFDESFGNVPLYIDITSALYVAGNCPYSPRAKHIARRYFLLQDLMKEDKISIHYVKSENQLANVGTKRFSKHRHRNLVKIINQLRLKSTTSSPNTRRKPPSSCTMNTCVLLIIFSALCSFSRVARRLHCSFVAGSSYWLEHFIFSFRHRLQAIAGQTRA